ncbi:hypothetical protein HMPREF0495_02104 [Levilactobacillus brevis ATCC 14869 = DSM 20054]|uniref:Uncharacterized protein n=1 Tax=Levilactobacillus brevis ATCC 14869 = DSM 20054 TaxID=649758 RepID=U2QSK9_LEVBR|nr:hypothetical protein HMPREF0495_02104 [Levilactobacillus brevis ATCC 14869 = DSM 20054]
MIAITLFIIQQLRSGFIGIAQLLAFAQLVKIPNHKKADNLQLRCQLFQMIY